MAGSVLTLNDVLIPDQLGTRIAQYWIEWQTARQVWLAEKEEIRRYLFAIDTTRTTNNQLPWKNKTTVPKLCHIRDNLTANYMITLFPKRRWLQWEPEDEESNQKDKVEAIENYMSWVIDQQHFKEELSKLILDYIDYGNAFGMPEWVDNSVEITDKFGSTSKQGYVGPTIKRISPLDIVFNPIATSFERTPKIIRSLVSLGEVKEMIERQSTPELDDQYKKLFNYLKNIRETAEFAETGAGDNTQLNAFYNVDGFDSFYRYLRSDYCELLTFYGDIYDKETDTFYRDYVVTVVDRHKVIFKQQNPSLFGNSPIYHVGWRHRQDNLWAMGPLDNLVGMQYRIDHIENLKADCFDLITFPPLKIKGFVEDFEWGPFAKIFIGDEGDVDMLVPNYNVLQANSEIKELEDKMEEMAGAPKEALGFRTPGEKTAYEVQRLENAANRVFVNKSAFFEEMLVEPLVNSMLELARRRMTAASIRVVTDDFKVTTFQDLTPEDITGVGRIKPVAARHFAERAETVQNINNFFGSRLGADQEVAMHFSSIKLAKLFEELLDLEDYKLVDPYVRIAERADAQRIQQAQQEHVQMENFHPSGLSQDDFHGPDLGGQVGASGSGTEGMPTASHGPMVHSAPSPLTAEAKGNAGATPTNPGGISLNG